MLKNVFLSGEYLDNVPQSYSDDSTWKANYILQLLGRNRISPRTIGDAGCGTGKVLRKLQLQKRPQKKNT